MDNEFSLSRDFSSDVGSHCVEVSSINPNLKDPRKSVDPSKEYPFTHSDVNMITGIRRVVAKEAAKPQERNVVNHKTRAQRYRGAKA
jgi:hypothetical protein